MVAEMNHEGAQFAGMGGQTGQKQQQPIMTRPIPRGPTARNAGDAMDAMPSTSSRFVLSQPDPYRRGHIAATSSQEFSAFKLYNRPLKSTNDQEGGTGVDGSSSGRDANSVMPCTR